MFGWILSGDIMMKRSRIMVLGLMLILSALPAYAATNETLSQLKVDGNGQVSVPPDMVTIELGVETRNVSSDVAAAENAELMNKTVNALLAAGVRKEEIQTSQYRLTMPSEEALIKALARVEQPSEYVATSSVTVKMNATADVGRILGAAVAAGSNKIKSVSFGLRDSEPQADEALAKAVDNARRKAEIMASSAGVKLGRVLDMSEGYSYYGYAVEESAFKAEGPTTTITVPLEPREVKVSAKVSITYEIIQPVP
jgi:uncharacterized protein YggE